MNYDYDIAVIGGGAGGLFAASVANTLGAKTLLVEKIRLGGDCTWFGCMPSKALLKSAQIANLFKRHQEFGLRIGNVSDLDTSGVMSHVRDIVNEIATHHPNEVFEKRGIKIIIGSPQFIDSNTIEVNNEKFSAKRFIICTGSHPVVPPIDGLKDIDYFTNENIFEIDKLPEDLIVLGGGPIGLEISQSLNRLGVKVSVVEMFDRVLFREDKEIAKYLEKKLIEEGVFLYTGQKAIKFSKRDKVYVTLEDKDNKTKEISAENILVAVGRAPNLEGLALEKANIDFDNKGLKVNSFLQTTNKDIFACGDIAGPYQFSHVAAYQASVCVRNAMFKRIAWQKVNYNNVAWATFTEPEISHLGLTEEEARQVNKDIKVYKTEYGNSDRAVTDLEKEGLIKIITDKKVRILGAHIAGAHASEIMQGFIIAKASGSSLTKLSQPMFIYPTLSELVKKTGAKPLIETANNPIIKFILKVMRRR
ncbi:dihydrolipoyl dehydrogenase family protein [Candidatus Omnitrophota bacterium]